MAGRFEIMQFAFRISGGDINATILNFENADPDRRLQMAHQIMVIKKTLAEVKSFDHKSVRPDNCYIICVAVI